MDCGFIQSVWQQFIKHRLRIILSNLTLAVSDRFLSLFQVNDINFENMSNDDAVRVLREIVHKPGYVTPRHRLSIS